MHIRVNRANFAGRHPWKVEPCKPCLSFVSSTIQPYTTTDLCITKYSLGDPCSIPDGWTVVLNHQNLLCLSGYLWNWAPGSMGALLKNLYWNRKSTGCVITSRSSGHLVSWVIVCFLGISSSQQALSSSVETNRNKEGACALSLTFLLGSFLLAISCL